MVKIKGNFGSNKKVEDMKKKGKGKMCEENTVRIEGREKE